MCNCSAGYSKPSMERLGLPPPIDGDNSSACLEILVANDNLSWGQYEADIAAAPVDPTCSECRLTSAINAAQSKYISRWYANTSAYAGCMGEIIG